MFSSILYEYYFYMFSSILYEYYSCFMQVCSMQKYFMFCGNR